ncbi:sugar transferase [Paucilactobacillus sp. N302-9]
MYVNVFKRIFDFITAMCALIILFIPFCIIAIIIKVDSHGAIFFKQDRVGKNGVTFKIYKFRSMYEEAPHEKATAELENAHEQITSVGKILRKTSIDELPQFINVLRGEMSMVGPRPVICKEVELIEMRHNNGAERVLPGLTGLAQVHGRDNVPNIKKASYDGVYAMSIGFRTDVKVVLRTIWYVILHVGVHEGKRSEKRATNDFTIQNKSQIENRSK